MTANNTSIDLLIGGGVVLAALLLADRAMPDPMYLTDAGAWASFMGVIMLWGVAAIIWGIPKVWK